MVEMCRPGPVVLILLGLLYALVRSKATGDLVSIGIAYGVFLFGRSADRWRSCKVLQHLADAVPKHVVIMRQGAAVETLWSDVVVGDVILLSKGAALA